MDKTIKQNVHYLDKVSQVRWNNVISQKHLKLHKLIFQPKIELLIKAILHITHNQVHFVTYRN